MQSLRLPFRLVNEQQQQQQSSLSNKTLMFHVEGALLRSSSLFPYFMLVAFEGGGIIRALLLFLLYPLVYLVGEEMGLKIVVFVCFVGIREESFRLGRTVLPKFFLEDVGYEGFDVVMRHRRKIGVSELPRVMVEGFLRDYLGVEGVVGRELKSFCGYFVGLMEEKKWGSNFHHDIIGFGCSNKSLNQNLFSHCEVVYLVSEAEKANWQVLPREKYPKPLIFHDGRLAFRLSSKSTLSMFIWIPFGFFLCIIRIIIFLLLPYKFSIPISEFIGLRGTSSKPKTFSTPIKTNENSKGLLYVCNHRTLLDPIHVSMAIMKPLTAVTYSLSRCSEVLSPIKTVRLTRDREKDSKILEKLLSQGDDLVVCPEGTTCREPYLLRFSPLFAEMSDDIIPVAIDIQVGMFYGTTASGLKCLDPVFLLMNPITNCSVKLLKKLPKSLTCDAGGKSKFKVADHLQAQIGKALKFECTSLSRKDKYMMLAGNEGKI
ncbi:probable glycerol-3-phosphate acyltransferase 3 [Pistacia vera]|uniref:probable glycerol-3-phosphate acyltransferase 3 n=1 Tax=Pistacia vera TaxID=55513 RepID=UPI001262AFC5|nr:probable glycerol-3-phosphate acyltransferase 3 [Pistacia vera]